MRSILKVGGACAALVASMPASAVTSNTNASFTDAEGAYTATSGTSFSSVAGASASVSPAGPTLTAQASSASGARSASASASLLYSFSISLPGPYATPITGESLALFLPLHISYAGAANASGSFSQAIASLTVRGATGTLFSDERNCSGDGDGCGSMGGTGSFDFMYFYRSPTQAAYFLTGEIEMTAYATGSDFGNGFDATAWVDPTITIDSAFASANPGFALSFEQVSPAPEPGEWAMIGAGLGIAGFAAKRRRRD